MLNSFLHLFHMANSACGTSTGWLPSLYDGLNSCGADGVTPEIVALEDVAIIIGNVVRILIAISGALAVILLLVASVYYITAMGDPGRVKRARDIIVNTTTGLIIIIMSYAVVTFIAGGF
jgi:hypothetical protein